MFLRVVVNLAYLKYLARVVLSKLRYGRIYLKGKNNRILNKGVLFKCKIRITGSNNRLIISKGAVLTNVEFDIIGDNNVVWLLENIQYSGGCIWMRENNNELKVKERSTIEGATFYIEESTSIAIGADCMLSYGIELRTGDSHSVLKVSTNERINHAKNIVIQDTVWVGTDVNILKGVTVGENSVIAAHTVVTKDIPPNTIHGGYTNRSLMDDIYWKLAKI